VNSIAAAGRTGADRLGGRLGRLGPGLYRVYWMLPESLAWRVLFGIRLVPAVFVFWIRRHIDEPEIFRTQRSSRPAVRPVHLFFAFRGVHLATTDQGSLMSPARRAAVMRRHLDADYLRTVGIVGDQARAGSCSCRSWGRYSAS